MLVADHADELREAFRFPDQPRGLARSLSSKHGMHALCREHGMGLWLAMATIMQGWALAEQGTLWRGSRKCAKAWLRFGPVATCI